MTLAPQSASCRTQVGPERTRVRSSTVKRERACEARGKGIEKPCFSGFSRVAKAARCDLNKSGAHFQQHSAAGIQLNQQSAAREDKVKTPQNYGAGTGDCTLL